jgi:hypothetical protein
MQRKRIPVKPNIRTEVRALPIRLGRQPNGNTGDDIATRDGAVLSQPVGHTGRQMAWPLAVEIVREADNLQSSPLTLATATITVAMPPTLGSGIR